jgi:glutathione S-transferase
MSLALYDWPWSPFCHKVRAILEHKQVSYQRLDVLEHGLVDIWRRGTGKVPALVLDDGRLLSDSTNIAYELEARFPDPPIIPSDPRARAECHLLEDWADESLYFVNLYYQWVAPEGRAKARGAFAKFGALGHAVFPIYRRKIQQQVRGQGTGRKTRADVDADLERHLSTVEQRLSGAPFLLGDAPMLCDFAWYAELVYLGRTEVGAQALSTRPATRAYVDRFAACAPRSLAGTDAKRLGVIAARSKSCSDSGSGAQLR